ncbi:MAG: geranylgeranylglyceryl/heptaprenylglyceryl phosphate synthase [Crocinitomicaceae bacterium]|nr:geranylgeranylglyceryl/heptaprenylglyceryl phosphate synthase [Crocinitomicaceae bacterium]
MFNHLINIQETPNAIALLIDPDKSDNGPILLTTLQKAHFANIDFIFIGGSTVTRSSFQKTVTFIKENSTLPLIIFPGSAQQISEKADALLYLSLLSGRNPDFLIGHHIESALELVAMNLEIIPTGYLLIDGGTQSSVAYVSQTTPIPRENISIVRRTAIAGKLQGKKLLFLDAGSGAKFSVPTQMVQAIKDLGIPLIVGGGVKNIAQIEALHNAGASVVVIGNKIEEDVDFLLEIKEYRNEGMKE